MLCNIYYHVYFIWSTKNRFKLTVISILRISHESFIYIIYVQVDVDVDDEIKILVFHSSMKCQMKVCYESKYWVYVVSF